MREPLERLCRRMDGAAFAASVVQADGTLLDAVRCRPATEAGPDQEGDSWTGFADILEQMQNSAQMLAAGTLHELVLSSQNGVTVVRPLGADRFLALSVAPDALVGKARYLCRVTAPVLQDAL